jgi:coenzyme F420-reducing hydrogenase alpha subunit
MRMEIMKEYEREEYQWKEFKKFFEEHKRLVDIVYCLKTLIKCIEELDHKIKLLNEALGVLDNEFTEHLDHHD